MSAPDQESTQQNKLRTRLQHAGVIIWSSFLTAGIGTSFFFAMFDPVTLGHITTWSLILSRMTGYTLGFFLFWLLTALTSLLTAYLLRQPPKQP